MLQRTVQNLDVRALVGEIRPGSEWLGDRIADPRHRMVLIGLLGGLGLTLTLVGVFGMTSYAVARRTQEIGVRMALGAQPSGVVARMIADAAWPVGFGLAGGLGASYFATRLIESFLFETPPHDPGTFAAAAALVAAAALLAAWIPARRAARVDPVTALRAE